MPQVYDGGEPCDITGQARSTEVRFVCAADAKDAIASIREAATCRYTLVFATPRLCAHPGFVTPEAPVHYVLCSLAEGPGDSAYEIHLDSTLRRECWRHRIGIVVARVRACRRAGGEPLLQACQ